MRSYRHAHVRHAPPGRHRPGPLEPLERRVLLAVGDTLATALPVAVGHTKVEVTDAIGNEPLLGRDVDMFKVSLQQGQRLVADVDATAPDVGPPVSSIDAVLVIFDAAGTPLASADDSVDPDTGAGSLDPVLMLEAPQAGDYFVAVAGYSNFNFNPNVAGSGSSGSTGAYRLQLSTNFLPVASNPDLSCPVGTPAALDLLATVTDADGDTLRLVDVFSPNAVINDNGTSADRTDDYIDYTPPPTPGLEVIGFLVHDGRETVFCTANVYTTGVVVAADPADGTKEAVWIGCDAADDVVRLAARKVGRQQFVEVIVNGASAGTFSPAQRFYVWGQPGNDTLTVDDGVAATSVLSGGAGNDLLRGGGGSEALSGGADDDRIIGGNGRDLLLGGAGLDQLDAGGGDDILVAGHSFFDDDPVASVDLLREWTRTDQNYSIRVHHVRFGGGFSQATLNAGSAFDDAVADALRGGGGKDLFFADGNGPSPDTVLDNGKDEYVGDVHE